ncbi:MAG: anti-sigma factor [Xanthobacteraceae bacterium]|nr:anti-sigma factor [Xanthobacteraceae bacterium]
MIAPMQDNDELMLQAYCDGELDAATMAQFERRLSSDAGLGRRADVIMALRKNIRALPTEVMPRDLESRVMNALGNADTDKPSAAYRGNWRALAACVCAGVLAGAVLMSVVDGNRARDNVATALISNHIRGLLAPQPFDVASSDRHTVKPWFTTRLPESPQVVDLTAAGFTLAGGRVDVIGQQPVATLVYRHGGHVVSLTTLPKDEIAPAAMSGYRVVSWNEGGVTMVAVSDLPQADIEAFAQAFRAEASKL